MWPLVQPGLAAGVVDFGPDFSSLLIGLVVLFWLVAGMLAAFALRDVLLPRCRLLAGTLPVDEEDQAAA